MDTILPQVILKTVKELSERDLAGVSKIRDFFLSGCTTLTTLSIPNTVMYIGKFAFSRVNDTEDAKTCQNLVNVNLDSINPRCKIYKGPFSGTPWLTNQTGLVFAANGKILIYACSDVTDKTIPDTVINLAYGSCDNLVEDSSFVIPDTIEICTGPPVTSSITKLTVGAALNEMETDFIPTTVTTLICRQPAGMEITLPTPGDVTGLTYQKNSRSMSIYTDNECIKNYSWSGDNVTATFYPLSDAPA